MVSNTGKPSEAYFEEHVPGLVFRLRDKADLVGLNGGRNVAAFGNPSDFLVATTDGVFFAEVKSTIKKVSFSLSCFTPAQKAAMYKLHKRGLGGLYQVYIHSLHHDQWYLLNATQIMNILSTGAKSIKWTDLKCNSLTSWSTSKLRA